VRSAPWLGAGPAAWAIYVLSARPGPGRATWRGRPDGRGIALTFDDGPDPVWTPRILDVLAHQGVRAAFFLVGQRAAAAPALVRRIAGEGHDLGNHTFGHRSLWRLGPSATGSQVADGHAAIGEACGVAPRFFRPPWGITNPALAPALAALATPCVFWSAQTEGLRPAGPGLQVARALRSARPGGILDLHDADGVPGAGARLRSALPGLIARLRDAGYALVPLRDLL
jgi:peptidoglycan/xylan/chitin deacetylase (PgdA/CDA1 family)